MITVGELIQKLMIYPKDFVVINEQNKDIVNIVNTDESVIISTTRPIGICNRSGGNVYPSLVKGYSGFSPNLDEDLYDFESEKLD